jgi:hypothetical protein
MTDGDSGMMVAILEFSQSSYLIGTNLRFSRVLQHEMGLSVMGTIKLSLLTLVGTICCPKTKQDADLAVDDTATMEPDLSDCLVADVTPFLALFADSHKEMSCY